MKEFDTLVDLLRKRNFKKVYLSHEPWQEDEAREFSQKLNQKGVEVVVAADVRPSKIAPRSAEDLKVVGKAIDGCDACVVYKKEYITMGG